MGFGAQVENVASDLNVYTFYLICLFLHRIIYFLVDLC